MTSLDRQGCVLGCTLALFFSGVGVGVTRGGFGSPGGRLGGWGGVLHVPECPVFSVELCSVKGLFG